MNILEKATAYHAWGFNVVPIGGDKRPVVVGSYEKNGKTLPRRYFWQQWQEQRQSMSDMDKLPWAKAEGVAGVCGVGDMLCIDFDHSSLMPVKRVLFTLGLGLNYRWLVKTPGGGYHIWVRVDGNTPSRTNLKGIGADHVELRFTGHYALLPGSLHPSGDTYQFINKAPVEPPRRLGHSKILMAYALVTVEKEKTSTRPVISAPGVGAKYAKAALRNEMNRLAMTMPGKRNDTLNECAFNLGQLVAIGELDESTVQDNLGSVAYAIGLGDVETEKTIRSGLKNGRQHDRRARFT